MRGAFAVMVAVTVLLTGCSLQTIKDMRSLPHLADNPENQEFIVAVRDRGVPVAWKSTLAQDVCHDLNSGTDLEDEVAKLNSSFNEAQAKTIVYWAITMACWESQISQRPEGWKDAAGAPT